ncbi:cysteine dioxygenase [Telmatospirillum siberiense]|uniref:Cysteine dioxygenase n=1 Tax=Telmatospirillum siberiense TaxID=382514 RepID=A0A2N3PMQ0_9PROT|nr:cysteine dioxygenase [Telmatospirillum siberiense]PKU21674.1 cysteine dioxygenase [Telmatospirillum siberiense]
MANVNRLRDFVIEATHLVEKHRDNESALLAEAKPLLAGLIASDDWLPEDYAVADPLRYRQYLLHADPLERLSVVSFVWGPGQRTPVHDHRVWGLVGVLRGAELSTGFSRASDGRLVPGQEDRIESGDVVAVSPTIGDIHSIANALPDAPSISIHVYGGNIGAVRRASFDPQTGEERLFISGYSNERLPNLWDRSRENG